MWEADKGGRGAGGGLGGEGGAPCGRASKPAVLIPQMTASSPWAQLTPPPKKGTVHSSVVHGALPGVPGVDRALGVDAGEEQRRDLQPGPPPWSPLGLSLPSKGLGPGRGQEAWGWAGLDKRILQASQGGLWAKTVPGHQPTSHQKGHSQLQESGLRQVTGSRAPEGMFSGSFFHRPT